MKQLDNTILEEVRVYEEKDIYTKYFLPRYRNIEDERTIEILLKNRTIPLNILETNVIIYLWETYSWAREFFIENIVEICNSFHYDKITQLIALSMSQKDDFLNLCRNIFGSQNTTMKVMTVDILLDLGFPATEELLIEPFLIKNEDGSHPPKMEINSIFDILEYRFKDEEIKEVFLNHYEELFESAIHEKMQILSSVLELSPNISSLLIEKYGLFLSYFRQIPSENQKWADEILSSIITSQKEEELLEELKEKFHQDKLILKDSGSFSIVLGTKEWVLKLCNERITWDCPRKSFLLNENEFRKILDENGVPIAGIDWQPYLPETDKKITKELIYKYLVEFRNQDLTLADSSALRYNSKNFRFLRDTKHLLNQGISLPDWFIKDPLVSIDIDAIYYRGENKEADRQMDEAISKFEKRKI